MHFVVLPREPNAWTPKEAIICLQTAARQQAPMIGKLLLLQVLLLALWQPQPYEVQRHAFVGAVGNSPPAHALVCMPIRLAA